MLSSRDIKCLAAVAAFGAVMGSSSAQAISNGDFEFGNTNFWLGFQDFGASTGIGGFVPVQGTFLGYVEAAAVNVYSTLTQTFNVLAGQAISGSVGFSTLDYLPFNDNGFLSISDGDTLTTLFASNVATVGDGGTSGWVPFNFVAPEDGAYTLVLGVRNRGDSSIDSYAVLDDVSVAFAEVPAPVIGGGLVAWGAIVLLAIGGAFGRRRQSELPSACGA
ncbi:MAG: hypothetical protein ACKVP4_14380 [Hyphomicrobium sp.]